MAESVSSTEAMGHLLRHAHRQPSLRLPLIEAVGHVLAHDVIAPWPLPSWTAASMDGYAVRAADVHGADGDHPIALPVSGGGDAGDGPPPPLAPGTAWRVATGGRVPEGADSVVRVEDTSANGEPRTANGATVIIRSVRDVGRNVRPAGGDLARGDVAVRAGATITPGVAALLAALGEAAPMVHRKPRVGIVTSGEEVVSLDARDRVASGERIADANAPMLTALVAEAGGVPRTVGPVSDSVAAIADAVREVADCDLVLTAGGISVGERDHVVAAMAALDAELIFRRVRIRPGGPTSAALLPDGRLWIALPGNPVSAFVTFHLFAAPVVSAMLGCPRPPAQQERRGLLGGTIARLAEPVVRDAVLEQFVRVTLAPADDGGPPWARLTGNQGSWVTSSIARAEGIARIPAGEDVVAAGVPVEVTPL